LIFDIEDIWVYETDRYDSKGVPRHEFESYTHVSSVFYKRDELERHLIE
jgi:hypothetical protein